MNTYRVVENGKKYQVVDAAGTVAFETIFPLDAEERCKILNHFAKPSRGDDGLDAERKFRQAERRFWGSDNSKITGSGRIRRGR